jgi:hypothetical protein
VAGVIGPAPRISPDAWQRRCTAGENAVRKALGPAVARQIKAGQGTEEQLGTVLGALVAIGDLMFHLSANGDRRVMEAIGVAYLRGAIRGEHGPLNADGSEYQGAPLDG